MLGWSGISTLSASFITSSRRLPCSPAGVSRTMWVVPLGGRTTSPWLDLPAHDLRQAGRAQAEPGARRLLAVDVAEHDGLSASGEIAREIGRSVVLPTPPFGLATTITGMQALPLVLRVC